MGIRRLTTLRKAPTSARTSASCLVSSVEKVGARFSPLRRPTSVVQAVEQGLLDGVCESKPFVCSGCIMKCSFLVQRFLKQVRYIVQRAPRERVSKHIRFIVQRVPSCPANSRSNCELV